VPVDDPIFQKTNYPQWVWYANQESLDQKERFEMLRDVAEHNAMFWNPEGVEKARGMREKTFAVSHRDFGNIIEQTFGRKIDLPETPKEGLVHSVPAEERGEQGASNNNVRANIDPNAYLEEELDEIRFVPFNK
jgi:hypothetical protein